MKILLISNMYPSAEYPFYGIFVKNFENQLIAESFEFEKTVIEGRGITKLDKINKYIRFFIDVFKKVKANDYDLIYVHYIGHSLLPLRLVQHSVKKPLVVNAHGSDVFTNSKVGTFIQKLVTPLIKKANLVVVPSDYFKDIVSEKFMIKKENIFVSPSGGIDTKLFKPQEIQKEIFTIGYVSRIDKGKGWDTLLDAVSLLNAKGFSFRVLMLGGGAEENLLLQKIEDLELENVVKFLGPKPHSELVSYFNQMSVFAFTTTRLAESLGLVGLEAMACGVPVVGSNIGGLPSYIKDGGNGKLFEAGNVEELVKSLEYFMKLDDENIQIYKVNALNTAQRYDSKTVATILADKLKVVYEK